MPHGFEPSVRGFMADMRGIDQGDQDIDVQQKGHGASSRSALMIARVTGV